MFSNPHPDSSKAISKTGAIYAVLAYTAWGLLPIYWKFFGQVSESEVLSHRIIWSMVFLTGLVFLQQRSQELHQLFQSPTRLGILLITALLLTFNWGLYIYGVNANRVVETSLGYFINPLVNVLLGFVFLKERLHLGQKLAVLLAVIGVANFVWDFGEVPWLALGLAFSFAFYGLLRKLVAVAPLIGLAVETLLLAPVAWVLVGYWAITGVGHLGVDWSTSLLFIGSGVITSFPLLWFNNAAKRLRLSTLGFFQYLAPSLQLMLGVFLYHEPFTRTHAVTFGFIWVALVIYSTTSLVKQKFS
ncbi:RarD protein, DMT superfamily transporter [Crinalium epipsammum PCC 9333]|uniref:RarD protein, DMT superfamily transporter n=1 Tax=Crinalium epipsammum PCC 9333 TaxID=1173022 RepID=K9VUK4_9CYAN|nr:EamA family transporter RarD [Crinalium epipsammum]AFZ11621.1 RarD protein, DMT superfamily transporter [Crinalium epipsammum PCC 9333]